MQSLCEHFNKVIKSTYSKQLKHNFNLFVEYQLKNQVHNRNHNCYSNICEKMADYIVSNDFKTMEEIWDDILRLHWEYLDTEENMEKLKMRRKLEGKIKRKLIILHCNFSILYTLASILQMSLKTF